MIALNAREELVLRMRFAVGCDKEHTFREIGEYFNVTGERARQVEIKAIRRLLGWKITVGGSPPIPLIPESNEAYKALFQEWLDSGKGGDA